jgi:hypothetical protein
MLILPRDSVKPLPSTIRASLIPRQCSIFYFPQNNGDIFCFDHLTNQKFMHSIPKLKITNIENLRFSIIIWGKKKI